MKKALLVLFTLFLIGASSAKSFAQASLHLQGQNGSGIIQSVTYEYGYVTVVIKGNGPVNVYTNNGYGSIAGTYSGGVWRYYIGTVFEYINVSASYIATAPPPTDPYGPPPTSQETRLYYYY